MLHEGCRCVGSIPCVVLPHPTPYFTLLVLGGPERASDPQAGTPFIPVVPVAAAPATGLDAEHVHVHALTSRHQHRTCEHAVLPAALQQLPFQHQQWPRSLVARGERRHRRSRLLDHRGRPGVDAVAARTAVLAPDREHGEGSATGPTSHMQLLHPLPPLLVSALTVAWLEQMCAKLGKWRSRA